MSQFGIKILTIFPDIFPGPFAYSLSKKAIDNGLVSLDVINIRDFANDKYMRVDDKTYGGGYGLVMLPEVLSKAIDHAIIQTKNHNKKYKIYYPSPRGTVFNQELAYNIADDANDTDIIILCGRFEAIDQRIIEEYNIEEISIGDFILAGGEIAAMAIIDSVVRLLPNVVAREETIAEESFARKGDYKYLLEYPHYTKPAIWNGRKIPDVLLSGNHSEIATWRLKKAEEITKNCRPDLWEKYLKYKKNGGDLE